MKRKSVNFIFVSNRQFSFLEISLVYDKSDQHPTIFGNYSIEIAADNRLFSRRISTHTLFDQGLLMMYKDYTISKQKDITA